MVDVINNVWIKVVSKFFKTGFSYIILENQRYDVLKYVKDETSKLVPQNHLNRMESNTEGMKLITSSRISNVHIQARPKALKFENLRSTAWAKEKTQ